MTPQNMHAALKPTKEALGLSDSFELGGPIGNAPVGPAVTNTFTPPTI